VAKDSHKNAETRRDLQPLVDLAAELGAALLGVTHFTKGSEGRQPIDRVTGSLAFGALSRVVWVAAQKQDDEGEVGARVLMLAKSNIGPDKGGYEYALQNVPLYSNPDIIAGAIALRGALATFWPRPKPSRLRMKAGRRPLARPGSFCLIF
jgi:putative DNA primase/helicase